MKKLSTNALVLKRLKKILRAVNYYQAAFAKKSDEALQAMTADFKARLSQGQSLDDILPEAFALVREADRRILGLFPYDVQVLGAIALHKGYVAEMKTGEGKTLTATMPLYLNALAGKGAMLVTTNNYLAFRDANEMGPVYQWLGLSIATTAYDQSERTTPPDRTPEELKAIYGADITYTTSSALGFDYLNDNLVTHKKDKFLRAFNYAIVDEADEVLLDAAQTPLIIAGVPRVQSNLYALCDQFVKFLKEDSDYHYDEEDNKAWITQKGWDFAERFFRVENLFDGKHDELLRHIQLALVAEKQMKKDHDYVVSGGKISLLDETNGRVLTGMRLQSGQHQAIEQKEGVEISDDMRAMATVTYQNLFSKFKKLAGMTGTAKLVENELMESYFLKVVQIPTHKPVIRIDYPDRLYTTLAEKLGASLKEILALHQRQQPVLIVTGSVEVSEIYSELLLQHGIAHNVLNAYNTVKEASIIADAGQLGAVTVATTLAGRGTDIKLGNGVAKLGGLAIIAVELLHNRRVDQQVRGRAGRQGDPGFSRFYVSLEDRLIVEKGVDSLHKYYKKHEHRGSLNNPKQIKNHRIKRLVKMAQLYNESSQQEARKQTVEFDESIRLQRERLYRQRNDLLYGKKSYDPLAVIKQAVKEYCSQHPLKDKQAVNRFIWDYVSYEFRGVDADFVVTSKNVVELVGKLAQKNLALKQAKLETDEQVQNFVREAYLRALDTAWLEEVDMLQQLKNAVMSRALGQRNPNYEYHKEALRSFEKMCAQTHLLAMSNLLLSTIYYDGTDIQVSFA